MALRAPSRSKVTRDARSSRSSRRATRWTWSTRRRWRWKLDRSPKGPGSLLDAVADAGVAVFRGLVGFQRPVLGELVAYRHRAAGLEQPDAVADEKARR